MTGSKQDLPSAASDARVTICEEKESTTLESESMAEAGQGGAVLGGREGGRVERFAGTARVWGEVEEACWDDGKRA